jgi:predicted DNA-binding transcriptional regulator AlpA
MQRGSGLFVAHVHAVENSMLTTQPERLPNLIRLNTLAKQLEKHPLTIMRWSKIGRLPSAIKLGRSVYFDIDEVSRRITEQQRRIS